MGLARRGSRRITVDGTDYRWVLSPDSGYVVLVVELLENPGQRLEALSDMGWHDREPLSVTPGLVARVIRLALQQNWQPAETGLPPFRIRNFDRWID
jgi:hypothetical protein